MSKPCDTGLCNPALCDDEFCKAGEEIEPIEQSIDEGDVDNVQQEDNLS